MHTSSTTSKLSVLTRTAVIMITLLVLASLVVTTVLAAETSPSSPSRGSTTGKGWTNISYSFASDNLYAVSRKNKQLKLSNFNIPGIPGHSTINGIVVTVEGFTTGAQLNAALSYDGGSSYTSSLTTALTSSDAVYTLGGPTNSWGRTWNAGEFTNNKFIVKLTPTGVNSTISVDQVQVKVYYTPPATTLTLSPVSGTYNGTASMSATLTLTADGTLIPSKTISFYVNGTGLDASGNCTGTHIGDAVTQAGTGTATYASASLSGIAAGMYPYGACASFAGDANYQATSITNSLTVIGTDTTLTASPATGMYGGTVSLSATLTLTSGGTPINNEYITFYLFGNELGSAKTNPSGVATLSNVSLTDYDAGISNDIEASFTGDSNLNPANAIAQITINQRPLTVTAVTSSKVYDGTTTAPGTPNIISGTLVTGDTASFTQTFDTKDVGTGKTITPTGAVDDGNSGLNYAVTAVPVTSGTISKASLTVKANNQTKPVKPVTAPDPAFTFQYLGLYGSDTGADINVAPTCAVSGAHNFIGTYPIVCSGGSDNNYNLSNYVNGTLTVQKAKLGSDTVGVFRPSNGVIYLKNTNATGYADVALNYGQGGDYPVTGDWDGNGTDTIGVYRNGSFYLRNSNTIGYANIQFPFGKPGDQPIAGDWNGDGIDTIGVFDPKTFTFYLRNSNTAGPVEMMFSLGVPGDVGIAGDWNGDGKDTVGVFRPSNGIIYLKNTNQTGYADVALNYGQGGDKPVTGDWNNDGKDTIGVLRGNVFYLRNSNTVGYADYQFALGLEGDMPISGNWDAIP